MAYVYRHIRLDKNEPFYIGIGSDNTYSRANEKCRRNQIWNKIIKKTDYKVEIVYDDVSFDFAKQKEVEFINLYGRIDLKTGTLTNMTNGGDGTIGFIRDADYRHKLSLAAKNRYKDNLKKKKLTAEELSKLRSKRMFVSNPSKDKTKNKGFNFKGNVYVYKDDVFIGEFLGVVDVEEKLNLNRSKISACLSGKRKTHKGYKFLRIK